ncbi:hypothetical protein OG596_15190 [Streptomyces sp. NBC_01102]|uniref:hypothetical protein n=1 Tax=Streptomyces sp. NBC_01102 TaxID=2903749 RepID=UPI0038685258|nr:hypothetical protein OG596_15190 [Streptomyces sp. NBC_01102]
MSTDTPQDGWPERLDRGDSVSDEQWAELVRQAESGGAEAPKEPSAYDRSEWQPDGSCGTVTRT